MAEFLSPRARTTEPRPATSEAAHAAALANAPTVTALHAIGATLNARARPVAQLVKKKDGITYAVDETEARGLMIAYAARIDVKPTEIELAAAIAVAIKPDLGIDQGERILLQKKLDAQAKALRDKRRAAFKDGYEQLEGYCTEGGLCAIALSAAFDRYVANPSQPNISVSGTYTMAAMATALDEWKGLNGTVEGIELWGYGGQNKAAAGKSNVGATLATRTVQGNLLSKWGGVTINVHVDIEG